MLEKYLKMTGQTLNELYGGAVSHGIPFILNELVPQAHEKKKNFFWKSNPVTKRKRI